MVEMVEHRSKAAAACCAAEPPGYLIELAGEIDLAVARPLGLLIDSFREAREPSVRVDLRAVTFFDLTGLRFLVRIRQLAASRGGTVTLDGPSSALVRLLTMTQLDRAFDLEPRTGAADVP